MRSDVTCIYLNVILQLIIFLILITTFFLKLHQCKENEVQIKPQIVLNMKILKFIVEDFEVYINSIVRNCI